MLLVVTVLGLSLLFGTCTQGESPIPDEDRQWPASGAGVGTGEELQGVEGSGAGTDDYDAETEDENEEDYYGNEDEEEEGSADVAPSPALPTGRSRCVKLRDDKLRYENTYRPQCTDDGAFEPMQCYDSTGECWCVNSNGEEMQGTMSRRPKKPDCYSDTVGHVPVGGDVLPAHTTPRTDDDDITYDVQKTTGPYADNGDDGGKIPDVQPVPSRDWLSYVLSQPLMLAGLIGGTVFVLLVVILMLMFIIYRMRKKDEGSYSLDEPRQSFGYTRAKDQEFFA
jgi:hypothetical protein